MKAKKISMKWLRELMDSQAFRFGDDAQIAVGAAFYDLRQLGLIQEDRIEWDLDDEKVNSHPPSQAFLFTELKQ